MIDLLKKPLSVNLQIRMKGNSLNPLVAEKKDLGAASQTLLTAVHDYVYDAVPTIESSFFHLEEVAPFIEVSASLFVHCFVLF